MTTVTDRVTKRKEGMKMSSNKKIVAVVLTTVALSIGAVGAAGASDSKGRSVSVKQSSTKISVNAFGNSMAGHKMGGHEVVLKSVLAGLVTQGTITQAQSDAITVALVAAHAARVGMHDSDDVGMGDFKSHKMGDFMGNKH